MQFLRSVRCAYQNSKWTRSTAIPRGMVVLGEWPRLLNIHILARARERPQPPGERRPDDGEHPRPAGALEQPGHEGLQVEAQELPLLHIYI